MVSFLSLKETEEKKMNTMASGPHNFPADLFRQRRERWNECDVVLKADKKKGSVLGFMWKFLQDQIKVIPMSSTCT